VAVLGKVQNQTMLVLVVLQAVVVKVQLPGRVALLCYLVKGTRVATVTLPAVVAEVVQARWVALVLVVLVALVVPVSLTQLLGQVLLVLVAVAEFLLLTVLVVLVAEEATPQAERTQAAADREITLAVLVL
jgi:hypothetical protein